MTKPQLTPTISLGNIITVIVLACGAAGAFFAVQFTSQANADDIAKNAARIEAIRIEAQQERRELEQQLAVQRDNSAALRVQITAMAGDVRASRGEIERLSADMRQLLDALRPFQINSP